MSTNNDGTHLSEPASTWVQTNLEFDLEVRHPDQTTETRPFIIDTFCQHHGAVEPTLYLAPSGKWVRRVSFAELPGLKPKPPLFIEITQPLATKWLWANGYPVPGCAAPVKANARIRDRRGPSPEQEYAHRLWHEGHLSQAEIAQEIQRLFHVPFAQSQVSRAIKFVDDWLQSIKADSPASRARRSRYGRAKPKRAQHARNRQARGVQRRRRLQRLTVRNQHNSLA